MDEKKLLGTFVVTLSFLLAAPGGAVALAQDAVPDSPAVATGGTGQVVGRIEYVGPPPDRSQIIMKKDPVCVAESEGLLSERPAYSEDGAVNPDGTLPNVFVYVKSSARNQHFKVPSKPAMLVQQGCVYRPHILGVMEGQEIEIISRDPTTHNIHVMPKINRAWNQSQPPGAPPFMKKFAHPEIMIPVTCNQHPWMLAYIGVTSNPFYTVTGSDGTYTIEGLQPGRYTLGAWTATFGSQQRDVTVKAGEATTLDFTFEKE